MGTLRFFRKGTFCARHIAKDKMEKSHPCIVCGTDCPYYWIGICMFSATRLQTINLCKITLKLLRANKQRSAPGNVLENLTKAIILLNSDNLFFLLLWGPNNISRNHNPDCAILRLTGYLYSSGLFKAGLR